MTTIQNSAAHGFASAAVTAGRKLDGMRPDSIALLVPGTER
jgi:hypothetical protein